MIFSLFITSIVESNPELNYAILNKQLCQLARTRFFLLSFIYSLYSLNDSQSLDIFFLNLLFTLFTVETILNPFPTGCYNIVQ